MRETRDVIYLFQCRKCELWKQENKKIGFLPKYELQGSDVWFGKDGSY